MWKQNIASIGGQYTSIYVIDNQTLLNIIYKRMHKTEAKASFGDNVRKQLKLNFSTLDSLLVSPTTVSAPRTATLL